MKKNSKLLITLGILLLLTLGSSFAYFVAKVIINGSGSEINLETANLIKVEYDAGTSSLNVNDLLPNHKASKTFTISITPTELEKSAIYQINLNIESNTFVKCDDSNYAEITNECIKNAEELVYYLKDSNGNIISSGDITGVTGKIVLIKEKKEVTSKTDYNYTLEIEFKETNADQNHNANKTITGNVSVEFASPDASEVILANNTIDESRISGEFTSTFEEDTSGRIFKGPADDYGDTTYFFAGANPNNWVKFGQENGKDIYWRIIRVNSDGTVRMIYNGTSTVTTGTGTQINGATYKFSHKDAYYNSKTDNAYVNDNAYVGYMYGTAGSDNYNDTHANINSSNIKAEVDKWYNTNLNKTGIKEHIDTNVGFCGDRKIYTGNSWNNFGTLGYNTNFTTYEPESRVVTWTNGTSSWATTQKPTFKCSQNNDLYTVSSSNLGNKALTYPVGLITMDEVVFAGGFAGTDSSNYWLYTNQNYWTISSGIFGLIGASYVFRVSSAGNLGDTRVNETYGVRPVINLKADTQLIGTGTTTDPYEVV